MLHFYLILFSLITWAKLDLTGLNYQTMEVQTIKSSQKKVVIFLSAICPCSHSHVDLIKKLKVDFPQFDFIGIHSNQNENKEVAKEYFKKNEFGFPILRDEAAKIADELKAYKTPHAYILDENDHILYQGGLTNSATAYKAERFFVREALDEIVANKSVTQKEGRTLGCVISREAEE